MAFGQSVPGQIGNALPFDGQSEANIPHIGSFNSNDITFEAWVRVDQLTGQQTVITDPGTSSLNIKADGSVAFRIRASRNPSYYGGTNQPPISYTITSNPGLIVPGQWHHIAGAYRLNTSITVSVDDTHKTELKGGYQFTGHPAFTNTHTPPLKSLVDSNNPLRIGLSFGGLIDEVRFWSGARSTGELKRDRAFALTGNEAGLAGLWHMDDLDLGDTTPPVVVLNGEAEMTIDQPYVEFGTTATDPALNLVVADAGPYANDGNYNGDISVPVTITGSVGSAPGDYTVTYTATDASGNTATAVRLVHVANHLYDWEQMPSSAADIAVGGNGDVWMIDGGSGIYKWDPLADDWSQVSGYGQRIGVAPDGTPWIVQDGKVLRWDPSANSFVQVPDAGAGGAIDIGMGGEVWVVAEHTSGGEHAAFRWNATTYSWAATGGYTGKAIDVAPDGTSMTVGSWPSTRGRPIGQGCPAPTSSMSSSGTTAAPGVWLAMAKCAGGMRRAMAGKRSAARAWRSPSRRTAPPGWYGPTDPSGEANRSEATSKQHDTQRQSARFSFESRAVSIGHRTMTLYLLC